MASLDLPPHVCAFVRANVRTVGHMEALAMAVEAPRPWSAAEVAARLYVTDERGAVLLRDLVAAGLLEKVADGARWRREAVDRPDLVEEVVRVYRERLIPMTQFIHALADPAAQISDAFRFRKE